MYIYSSVFLLLEQLVFVVAKQISILQDLMKLSNGEEMLTNEMEARLVLLGAMCYSVRRPVLKVV